MIRFPLWIFLCTALLITPAHAQDKAAQAPTAPATTPQDAPVKAFAPKDFAYGYSPEYCDFVAGFPEEPLIIHHCEDENDPSTCFNLVSYTKVFGLSSTVKVEAICNPAGAEMYEHFTPETMEKTVRAMTKDKVVKEFKVDSRDEKEYRQSGLVAQGRQGLNDTLYIAQLWVANNSIMSVEAELMGEQTPEADELFANILRNIGYLKDIQGEELGGQKIQAYEAKKAQALAESAAKDADATKEAPAPKAAEQPAPKK
tara:strand:+ start:841 stop:1611 length:771 start_codon:yes stop_codon:yes gene_type:complete